jgi:APA family basic amino acid/polyamine antiporter
MWGYPVTPLLFVAITGWFLVNMLVTRPVPAFAGLGLILIGIPVFYIWVPKAAR